MAIHPFTAAIATTQTNKVSWDIYNELGATSYFERAYRMIYQTFKHLAVLLCPLILSAFGKKGTMRHYRNGPISPDVRLACAIRWFAGGSAYDIMTTYGISPRIITK